MILNDSNIQVSQILGDGTPLSDGVTALIVTGLSSPQVLTPTQLQNRWLNVTGVLTANMIITVPLVAGSSWRVWNGTTGAFTLTLQGITGTGVAVTQGKRCWIETDGVNFTGQTAEV